MLLHKMYDTEEERSAIIAEMKKAGFTLVEQDYFIGDNHLLFDDGKPDEPKPRDLKAEIDEIKARMEMLERE